MIQKVFSHSAIHVLFIVVGWLMHIYIYIKNIYKKKAKTNYGSAWWITSNAEAACFQNSSISTTVLQCECGEEKNNMKILKNKFFFCGGEKLKPLLPSLLPLPKKMIGFFFMDLPFSPLPQTSFLPPPYTQSFLCY